MHSARKFSAVFGVMSVKSCKSRLVRVRAPNKHASRQQRIHAGCAIKHTCVIGDHPPPQRLTYLNDYTADLLAFDGEVEVASRPLHVGAEEGRKRVLFMGSFVNFGVVYGSVVLILAAASSAFGLGFRASSGLSLCVGCAFASNALQLGPRWLASLWARFMHTPDALVWSITGKRPFNFDPIESGLYLGRQPRHEKDVRTVLDAGITAFVVLNESWELCVPRENMQLEKWGVRCVLHLPAIDFSAPSLTQIGDAVAFLEANIPHGVYVHCNGGKGRSAVVVIAYLMKKNGWALAEAYEYVRGKRKIANMKKFGGLFPQWRILKAYTATLPTTKKSS